MNFVWATESHVEENDLIVLKEAVETLVSNWLTTNSGSFNTIGIKSLPKRWKKCIDWHGDWRESLGTVKRVI